MPGYESAAKGPIIEYENGEETLYLHSWNSRVVCYRPPYAGMSHVEHWIGEQGETRRLWDENLIKTLKGNNFMDYLIDVPKDPVVLDEYAKARQSIVDGLDLSDLVGLDIDQEWNSLISE